MIRCKGKLVFLALLLLVVAAPAQRRRGHDPLTEAEADQLREVNQEPVKRIKLIIKFATGRLQAVEQLRGDPKTVEGRGKQIHDLLADFTAIVDELDDNLDMYGRRKDDVGKVLGDVIAADSGWQARLRGLKEAAQSDPQAAAEAREYGFALDNAMEAVNSSASNARDLKEEIAKQKQEEKKKGKSKD